MKRFFLIFVIAIFVSNPINSQDEPDFEFECVSKQREEYRKSKWNKSFKPISKRQAKNFHKQFDWFTIYKEKATTPYTNHYEGSFYRDSLFELTTDSINIEYFFSVMDQADLDTIGPIPKYKIINHGRMNDTEAILYEDRKYNGIEWSSVELWIAVTFNGGKSWKSYPSGLSQNSYYHFKHNTRNEVFVNDSIIRFEAAIVKKTRPAVHPFPPAEYELVQDGIFVEFNLAKITADSDKDGFSNIEELIFNTDPFNEDTDNDGINDFNDPNPKYKKALNDTIMIYELITMCGVCDTNFISSRKFHELESYKKQKESYLDTNGSFFERFFIITDDPNLQRVSFNRSQVIILTFEEYEKLSKWYPSRLNQTYVGPLFRCDNREDTFIIIRSRETWGDEYIIYKQGEGWIIVNISSWIS